MQAILNASAAQEEFIKELLVSHGKVRVQQSLSCLLILFDPENEYVFGGEVCIMYLSSYPADSHSGP